jgi:hypothetical protein
MNPTKVRVAYFDDTTMVCLEDLIDFYSFEYTKLLKSVTNGHGAKAQSSDTAVVLAFLMALKEDFETKRSQDG